MGEERYSTSGAVEYDSVGDGGKAEMGSIRSLEEEEEQENP